MRDRMALFEKLTTCFERGFGILLMVEISFSNSLPKRPRLVIAVRDSLPPKLDQLLPTPLLFEQAFERRHELCIRRTQREQLLLIIDRAVRLVREIFREL